MGRDRERGERVSEIELMASISDPPQPDPLPTGERESLGCKIAIAKIDFHNICNMLARGFCCIAICHAVV